MKTIKEIQEDDKELLKETIKANPLKYLISPIEWEKNLAREILKEQSEKTTKSMKDLKDLGVDDKVFIDTDRGFCSVDDEPYKIEKVSIKYDEDTGESFKVFHVNHSLYDSRDGYVYKNPNSWFYIISGEEL